MPEGMVRVGDIEMWTQDFGEPGDPAILLITGPGPGLVWPDELCERLAARGRHVISYDHRNIGRSSTVDFAAKPYTISDVAADAVGVLDGYAVEAGHLVGFSGGGIIAQTVAIEHPDRVATLTSWGSSPLGREHLLDGSAKGMPAPDPRALAAITNALEPVADPDERMERFVEVRRAFAGTLEPVDEREVRDLAERMAAHTKDPEAIANHLRATASPPDRTEALGGVTVPTLVIHGADDPIVPLPHGEATARAVPGARLLVIERLGHDMPRSVLPRIVEAIIEHTAPVEAKR